MIGRTAFRQLARLRWTVPLWVLFFGLTATGVAAYYAARTGRAKDQVRFQNEVDAVVAGITARVDTYVALLRAGAGLFEANGNAVNTEQFRRFVERLDLRGHYPGMQGLGFAVRVPAEEVR